MPFTYAWTAIPDTDTDPDSPVTTGLMTGLNHDLIHLREWIGASYFVGAAPDHDHDGTNSKIATVYGQGINRAHMHEIYDHFCYNTSTDQTWWIVGGTPVFTADEHFCELDAGDTLTSYTEWQIEQAHAVFEARCRMGSGTDWLGVWVGVDSATGAGRGADFEDAAGADGVRCETRGTAGGSPEQTDIVIGGGGVDAWHTYKIDLSSPTSVIFSVDSVVVATHNAVVPDALDLHVYLDGATALLRADYVKLYFTAELHDSAA